MSQRRILLIGGSAGSLDIVMKVLPLLTPEMNLPVIVILHRKNSNDNILAEVLSKHTKMPVREPDEKEQILPNTVYVAPADYHLLLEKDFTFSLDASEKINYSRPSIDVTFESATSVFGSSTIAILLSGANADGVEGLLKIKSVGGTIIVQDPATAEVPYMPQQALNALVPNLILKKDHVDQLRGVLTTK